MTPIGVALEITPPRERRPELLLRRARLLGGCASAVHVIQRSARQSSLEASLELERAGTCAVWHLTNRGRGAAEIEAEIERAARSALSAALVVRGEAGPEDRSDTPTLRALVARIRSALPGARIGVTLNPYLEPERALANLWPKLEAGATFVQTQPVFVASTLYGVAERIRQRAPGVSILPMAIPLVSLPAAEKLALRLRLPLPHGFAARLAAAGASGGWALFSQALHGLKRSGVADGLALMTQEMDPPAAFGERIQLALLESGWA